MRWAIALALEGAGCTSPNPMVGAVVVKGGRIAGEGFHRRAGTPHAEVHALREAGKRAAGADLYVTLEPCCHFGRTPPCVPAIVEAGIRRVIVGTRDPNPRVDGRGIAALKKAGIRVVEGVLGDSCREINEAYNTFISAGRPFVTAKVALTLDGKIAARDGSSRWITNAESRRYVHELRSRSDAVMVGLGTVQEDDPELTVRLPGRSKSQPIAVVVDEELSAPRKSRIFKRRGGGLVVAVTHRAPPARVRWAQGLGHRVLPCRALSDGRVHPAHLLAQLGTLGITSVLLEGGGRLFADFLRRGLIDRLICCIAPKLVGGEGRDFLPGFGVGGMAKAIALHGVTIKAFGDNVIVEGALPPR